MCDSAQLSCHDAPIFRLLLKIAVSLTAFNVTFTIFVRLRAANNTSSIFREDQTIEEFLKNIYFPVDSRPSWLSDVAIVTVWK